MRVVQLCPINDKGQASSDTDHTRLTNYKDFTTIILNLQGQNLEHQCFLPQFPVQNSLSGKTRNCISNMYMTHHLQILEKKMTKKKDKREKRNIIPPLHLKARKDMDD